MRVLVEERRLGAPTGVGAWRTHEYSGLETIPERVRPAFASPGTGDGAELDVLTLLYDAYVQGLTHREHQAPYRDGAGCDKATVQRSVTLYLSYKAGAAMRDGSRAAASQAAAAAMVSAA